MNLEKRKTLRCRESFFFPGFFTLKILKLISNNKKKRERIVIPGKRCEKELSSGGAKLFFNIPLA
jgi:hypothetical protein